MTSPLTAVGEERLRECPFCGASNAMMFEPTCRRETPYNAADRLFPIVRCMSCYCEVAGANEDYRGGSAIAAWNRRSPVPEGDGLRVKALEWRPSEFIDMYFADSLVGKYAIYKTIMGDWILTLNSGAAIQHDVDADEAKAAAQADYTARILSVLASPAPVKAEAEVGAMTVIDPDAWEPCSPSYLERGGNCDAPRVWNSAENNHYHPKLAATPSSGGRREALEAEDAEFENVSRAEFAATVERYGKALALIASHAGKTLVSIEHGKAYSLGANAAFEDVAEHARAALANTNPTAAE